MFKLFGRKVRRGVSKSPTTKAKEQQALTDTYLAKVYLDDLKAHPEYARQVAREKYGMVIPSGGFEGAEAPPDVLEILRQAKEAKDLIKDELGEKTGILQMIPEIMRALPVAVAGLQQLQGTPQQPPPQPKVERLEQPKKSTLEEQQQGMVVFVERLMATDPTDVAAELYACKDEPSDIRSLIWQYATQSNFDSLLEMLPQVNSMPNYKFLEPTLSKVDRKWLALVFDEVNTLKDKEDEGNLQE